MNGTPARALVLATALVASGGACGGPTGQDSPAGPGGRASSDHAGGEAAPGARTEEAHARTVAPGQLDAGRFLVFVGDERMGEEQFEIFERDAAIIVRSRLRLTQAESFLHTDGELTLDRAWKPIGGKLRVRSEGQDASVELAMVDGRLEQTITPQNGSPETVRAEAEVDLYLGEASVAFASPLCRQDNPPPDELVLFPGTRFPVERSGRIMVPADPDADDPGHREPRALTVVAVDPQSPDSLITLCEDDSLVLMWLPAIDFAAARPGYEELALELSTRSFLEEETPAPTP